MSDVIVQKLDQWLQRLARDSNGFQIGDRGTGGCILRARSAVSDSVDDVGYFSIGEETDTTEIAREIFDEAHNDADGQGAGPRTYVVYAYRNEEQKSFARFSLRIENEALDESAIDLPGRKAPVFQAQSVSESAIEMHMRHSENTHRMMIGSTHALMEGFLQQNKQLQKSAEIHSKMIEDNLSAAHELAQRREERDARLEKEKSRQELFGHVVEKLVEIGGPFLQIGLAQLVQKLAAGDQNGEQSAGPRIVSAEPVDGVDGVEPERASASPPPPSSSTAGVAEDESPAAG
jgi:hypothetical protein